MSEILGQVHSIMGDASINAREKSGSIIYRIAFVSGAIPLRQLQRVHATKTFWRTSDEAIIDNSPVKLYYEKPTDRLAISYGSIHFFRFDRSKVYRFIRRIEQQYS